MRDRRNSLVLWFAIFLAIASINDGQAVSAATTTIVAQTGQAAPDGNGILVSLSQPPVQTNSGMAGFYANLTATNGGTNDNSGIYSGNGGSLTQLARKGQTVPGGGTISSYDPYVVFSNVGLLAFRASLTGSGSPAGIYRHDNGALTQIARTGQLAPGGDGTISNFTRLALNDFGQVAFAAQLSGTLGGDANNFAVYRGSGGTPTQIARKGQTAPDGNGSLSSFDNLYVSDVGEVAFGEVDPKNWAP